VSALVHGGLAGRAQRALDRLLDRPALFHAARYLLVGGQGALKQRLRAHVGRSGQSTLDVCCGIGEFADLIEGPYLGIDLNPRFIGRARARHRAAAGKQFEVGDVMRLAYPDGCFEQAMIVNSLHHFSDADAIRLLAEIRRVSRRLVVVVDADGAPPDPLRRALIAMDRGRHMRPPARLAALVGQVLPIATTERFGMGLYRELLFRCPIDSRS
jgi:ubiquinone/menaquinone biosynthesis C-methylase UbiE